MSVVEKVDPTFSNSLDPEFVRDIQADAKLLDENQEAADESKWNIAARTNEMWPEHKGIVYELTNDFVYPTKNDFYAEVSRVGNTGLKHKRFSDSGETLRRWCEVQATYAQFDKAELFLEVLSFDHLAKAKKLARDEKVKVPILALAEAQRNHWTADEMKEHFDPSLPVHPYDRITGWLDGMLDNNNWKWLKSRETVKGILFHAAEIKRLISEDK